MIPFETTFRDYTETSDCSVAELVGKVIGCALEVHRRIGNGFHEVVYKRSLAYEFFFQNIPFEREAEFVGNIEIQGFADRADFIVDGEMMVELISVLQVEDEYLAQTLDYLKENNLKLALLINFGRENLEFKQITNTSHTYSVKNQLTNNI